ncbi:hypothetical protein NUU61_001145 [Penicillium alfredii]|uniref:Small ribosomal subunit protein mS38 n=1 Tax=Penicillium alfredii TaxID=1506179 RepID=A0A9W9GB23_9EURO|nr:uncharacterized protein NUU61_001145 [Penicillium alfredii]KAJ5115386.1 hypothetical protein NUU61_001145 [Penicillium alfredii]
MLSTSLRRAAWAPLSNVARPAQSLPPTSPPTASARPAMCTNAGIPLRPNRPDGPRRMDASAPAKGVNGAGEKSKAPRRRGKENSARNGSSKSNQHAAFSKLPSVPSTQHRQPHDVQLASFFSIHRPISVTTTVPPISSAEAFDAIFASRKSLKNESDDVIFTLSSTVESMETTAQSMSDSEEQLHRSFASDQDGEIRMVDVPETKLSVEELTRRLRPFHPPPPPTPMDTSASEAMESADAQKQHETSTYSTVLTIRESRHADGRKTYEAHTGPFVRDDEVEAPAGVRGEATIDAPSGSAPGASYIERLRHNRMQAISTRRRRKAKMKKHKFKKLLKRTRTLRRKLDKA